MTRFFPMTYIRVSPKSLKFPWHHLYKSQKFVVFPGFSRQVSHTSVHSFDVNNRFQSIPVAPYMPLNRPRRGGSIFRSVQLYREYIWNLRRFLELQSTGDLSDNDGWMLDHSITEQSHCAPNTHMDNISAITARGSDGSIVFSINAKWFFSM